jgi:hypothetical protein
VGTLSLCPPYEASQDLNFNLVFTKLKRPLP